MRAFDAELPTDQEAKYRLGRHGRALEDAPGGGAAECVACHGVHGIMAPRDPRSPVHARNVPTTCGGCHADAALMKNVTLADGSPMPVDQLDEYRTSVHGRALLDEGDLGAPACNDCHGSHGSAFSEVAQSCRSCHSGNAEMFDGSAHKRAFEQHGWSECGACHGDHAVGKTHDGMLGSGADSVCTDCHARYAPDKPQCRAASEHFHQRLDGLAVALDVFESRVEHVAARGLDTEPIAIELAATADALRAGRSVIHAFDIARFDETVADADAAAARAAALFVAAEDESARRRRGLYVVLALTALLGVLIRIKLARMEKPG
jgi:hypothetical protein